MAENTGDKVVVITGTSSGIGLEAAVGAARDGWHVVATMRDTGKAELLRKAAQEAGVTESVQVKQMDVTDAGSVERCIAETVAEHGALHALVNNAGTGHVGTLEIDGVDTARQVMEVNFFGVLNATYAALPHLRESRGRVVTVTSVGGVVGQPFNEAYCAAKFAVEGFFESLAPVAATLGVGVTIVEPGAVASEFVSNVGIPDDRAELLGRMGPYAPALENYLARTAGAFANAQSSADAAAVIVAALAAGRPAVRVQTSITATAFVTPKLADLDGSKVLGMTSTWVG